MSAAASFVCVVCVGPGTTAQGYWQACVRVFLFADVGVAMHACC